MSDLKPDAIGYTVEAACDLLRQATLQAGGVKAWAREHDMNPSAIFDMLAGRRGISSTVARHLGLRRATVYLGRE